MTVHGLAKQGGCGVHSRSESACIHVAGQSPRDCVWFAVKYYAFHSKWKTNQTQFSPPHPKQNPATSQDCIQWLSTTAASQDCIQWLSTTAASQDCIQWLSDSRATHSVWNSPVGQEPSPTFCRGVTFCEKVAEGDWRKEGVKGREERERRERGRVSKGRRGGRTNKNRVWCVLHCVWGHIHCCAIVIRSRLEPCFQTYD